jgi:hypothetical protein
VNLASFPLNTAPILTASGENAVYSVEEPGAAEVRDFPSGKVRTTRYFTVTRTTTRSTQFWTVRVVADSDETPEQIRTYATNPAGNEANLGGRVYRRAALIALGLDEVADLI